MSESASTWATNNFASGAAISITIRDDYTASETYSMIAL